MGTFFTILTIIGILLFIMSIICVFEFFFVEEKGKTVPKLFQLNWPFLWTFYTGVGLLLYGCVWIISKLGVAFTFLSLHPTITMIGLMAIGIIIIFISLMDDYGD